MGDLSCQELVELVTEYFEHALPAAERVRFETHLAECDGCDAHLEQVRLTIRATGATAALERAPEVTHLLAAFRDWKHGLKP